MVRRSHGLIAAIVRRIAWRELWMGMALGEALSLLALCIYGYLHH